MSQLIFMVQQNELLIKMAALADDLVENAKSLNEAAKRTDSEEELNALQTRQHEILDTLQKLDRQLKKDDSHNQVRFQIQEKLKLFEKINGEFLAHVSHNFRLIQKKDLAEDVLRDLLTE